MSQADNGNSSKIHIHLMKKKISNKFLIVSDNTNPKNKDRIIKGNQKVTITQT